MTTSGQGHAAPQEREAAKVRPYTYRGEGTRWIQKWQWGFGRFLSRIIGVLMFRLRVRGLTQIPKRGPVLLVTNHQSFLDPWLIGIAPQRQVHYMARDTLFKGGVLQWLIERLNAYPIKRGQADRAAIAMTVERLEKGFMVNIFPEGTRSEDGTIGPISPGLVLILKRCKQDVPVVPTVIDGAFDAWPRDRKLPRPHPIRIIHGKPIQAQEWRAMSPEALALRIRTDMIGLQRALGSIHAAASARRLAEDGNEARRAERPAGTEA